MTFDHGFHLIEYLAVNLLSWNVPFKSAIINDIAGIITNINNIDHLVVFIYYQTFEERYICHGLTEWMLTGLLTLNCTQQYSQCDT